PSAQLRPPPTARAPTPRCTETVPKSGYRLLVPAVSAANPAPPQAADGGGRARRHLAVIAAAACLVALAGLLWSSPDPISAEADRLFQEAESLAGTSETNKVTE